MGGLKLAGRGESDLSDKEGIGHEGTVTLSPMLAVLSSTCLMPVTGPGSVVGVGGGSGGREGPCCPRPALPSLWS